jgi:hypothetical protein
MALICQRRRTDPDTNAMARSSRLLATSWTADTAADLGRVMLVEPAVVEPVVVEPGMLVEIFKVLSGFVFMLFTG